MRPDELAIRFGQLVEQGDDAAAHALWEQCSPRAKFDLAAALACLLTVAFEQCPAFRERLARGMISGQN